MTSAPLARLAGPPLRGPGGDPWPAAAAVAARVRRCVRIRSITETGAHVIDLTIAGLRDDGTEQVTAASGRATP